MSADAYRCISAQPAAVSDWRGRKRPPHQTKPFRSNPVGCGVISVRITSAMRTEKYVSIAHAAGGNSFVDTLVAADTSTTRLTM